MQRSLIKAAPNSFIYAVTELALNLKRKNLICPAKDNVTVKAKRYVIGALSRKSETLKFKRQLLIKYLDIFDVLVRNFLNGIRHGKYQKDGASAI